MNAIIKIDEFGKPQLELDCAPLLSWMTDSIAPIVKNPLDAWKIDTEIKNIGKVLASLNLDWKDVNWSKVHRIGLLEILQGVKNIDPNVEPELGQKWKKLLEDFLNPEKRNKAKYVRAAKLLNQMDLFTVKALEIIYSAYFTDIGISIEEYATAEFDKFGKDGGDSMLEINRLSELKFLVIKTGDTENYNQWNDFCIGSVKLGVFRVLLMPILKDFMEVMES